LFQVSFACTLIVAEGLQLAAGAKVALMEAYVTNGVEGMPFIAYPGTGPSPAGSYNYEFTPTDNVKAIMIKGASFPSKSPYIRIDYGGKNKYLEELGVSINLSPGYGGIAPIGDPICSLFGVTATGSPAGACDQPPESAGAIMWGCVTYSLKGKPFRVINRYVPARCRRNV
jgi:hypothetical protein